MNHYNFKVAPLRHDRSPTLVGSVEPVVSAMPVQRSGPSARSTTFSAALTALRFGLARSGTVLQGQSTTDFVLGAASCLITPVYSRQVSTVSCQLPPESWFDPSVDNMLADVADLLGNHRSRLKFEVPYTFLTRTAGMVMEMVEEADFEDSPLWIQIDHQSLPLIGELMRFRPSLIIAPDDLANRLKQSAGAREDLLYFRGLAAAVGCPLLVPMVGSVEQMECIVTLGGSLVSGAWPSSALAMDPVVALGERALH